VARYVPVGEKVRMEAPFCNELFVEVVEERAVFVEV